MHLTSSFLTLLIINLIYWV